MDLVEHDKLTHPELVPHAYSKDPSFAEWIHRQRTTHASMLKAKKVNPVVKERMEQLKAMGFNFTVHSDKWVDHWNQLKEYKSKHGVRKIVELIKFTGPVLCHGSSSNMFVSGLSGPNSLCREP